MKMKELEEYGFSSGLIEIWEKEESEDLLPIQEEAIKDYNLLEAGSDNLLIVAPTSSGKTFVGELAAVKEALEMRRAIFLVPYRAIAEEHYANFVTKYHDYGLRVVISDRDHREYDEDIVNGDYQIAIIVYEKLAGLFVMNPELLAGCSLVVADEVQMMMDKNRGPTIELLLTKILLSQNRIKIIALSAVLEKLNGFDSWLNAKVLKSSERPIELRESIYSSDGEIRYREHNSKKRGDENFDPWEEKSEALEKLVQRCIVSDEQVLIFCSTRPSTVNTAQLLAEKIANTTPAVTSIKRANDLTDSSIKEGLQDLFQSGIAYHNSDLSLEERLLIEQGFRENDIKVIACTSTLAMGVNVPARNVIIYETQRWVGSQFAPIGVAEYKNMAGRAGRYSYGDPFGRSYLIAKSPAAKDSYNRMYLLGNVEGFSSSFGEQAIDSQVLDIIAGGLAKTAEEVFDIILATYNGKHKWVTDKSKEVIKEMIADAITRCVEYEAIEIDNSETVNVTQSGRICAAGGYKLDHLQEAIEYLKNYNQDVDLSVIYWSLEADYLSGVSAYHIPRLTSPEFQSGKYQQILVELANEENVGPLLDHLASHPYQINYEQAVILRRSLACYSWISSTPSRQIEKKLSAFTTVTIGAIRNTVEVCAWLISFLKDLAKSLNMGVDRVNYFHELTERLSYGATKESLSLAKIKGSGLSRDERNHLVKKGITSIDDILEKEPNDIPLSQAKAIRLIKACEETIENNIEKLKRSQQTRLRSLSQDATGLNRLYEATGTELERVIDDLLSEPFINLTCRHVTRQNEGEPDHLLYDDDGNVFVIQTTARERKNISMKKATSVIGQSSKYNPSGFIVIGRPDFEELAIRDSKSQVANGKNYKLIPVPVLAEMYVLFREGKITTDDVEKIFVEWTGYINSSRLYDMTENIS